MGAINGILIGVYAVVLYAIGMFRAITEINVFVQLLSYPLIAPKSCTFHCSRVISPHNSKYVNYGFES